MIQNLENKMELQINSLEARIEKMQERFNKDLEEIQHCTSSIATITNLHAVTKNNREVLSYISGDRKPELQREEIQLHPPEHQHRLP